MKKPIDDTTEKARRAYADSTAKTAETVRVDAVYTRIAAELRAPPRRQRAWWWLAVPVAAMLVAALIRLWPPSRTLEAGPGEVVLRSGAVTIADGRTPLERDSLTAETVRLGASAKLELALPGDVRTALHGPARITLGGGHTTVSEGRARFAVRSRVGREPYRMHAGDADILVRGTDFEVTVDAGKLACLRVSEGIVEVRRGDERSSVTAGKELCPSPAAAAPIELWQTPPWQTSAAETTERLTIDGIPSGATVTLDGKPLGEAPLFVRVSPGEHRLTYGKDGYESATRVLIVRSGGRVADTYALTASEEPAPPINLPASGDLLSRIRKARASGSCARVAELVTQLRTTRPSTEHEGAALLELAECHMETGAPRRALEVYERLVTEMPRRSSVAETALFEQARILSDLGRRADALAVIDTYIDRYGKGRLVAQATFRRCELLIGLEQLPRARACLEGFRATFTSDSRADDALLLLATLARAQTRWADAAVLYRDYLKNVDAPRREEAMYQLAKSLTRGKLPGASAAVTDYLEAYPDGRFVDDVRSMRP